jgi:hemolysin III
MAIWCLFSGTILLRLAKGHSRTQRISLLAYTLCAVTLYTLSGLFHGIQHGSEQTRRIWQLLDQTAIYWLIVGSSFPISVYLLQPRSRNILLGSLILLASAGTGCLWLLPKAPHELLVGLYVLLGVLSLIPLRSYFRIVRWRGMIWVGWLTFWYLLGAACEALKWPVLIPDFVGPHELLHICDILGTMSHLIFLIRFVLPYRVKEHDPPDDGSRRENSTSRS